MSLRWRLALVLGVVTALAVALAGLAVYASARNELLDAVDRSVLERATTVSRELGPRRFPDGRLRPEYGFGDTIVQLVSADGVVVGLTPGAPELPVETEAVRPDTAVLRTVTVDGTDHRMVTVRVGDGATVQVARSLAQTEEVLASLRTRVLVIAAVGAAAAALLGWLVARRLTRPVVRLAAAAEHVARTQDLSTPVPAGRRDEVGRLAGSFNAMLAALAGSREQQRRLVEDASHELRTPLTSLRTNAEVLRRADRLAPDDRARLLADVELELQELTDLVEELVTLARDPAAEAHAASPVRLDEVADAVAERARRRSGRAITVAAEPCTVLGSRALLDRAVANLVDNALKFSPPDAPVEIGLLGGRLTVRDHGPGIDADDRERVFERFYRAPAARSAPGSGLGLSIVRQVVEAHGGRVEVAEGAGGGAVVGFTLPVAEVPGDGGVGGGGLAGGAPVVSGGASAPAPDRPSPP